MDEFTRSEFEMRKYISFLTQALLIMVLLFVVFLGGSIFLEISIEKTERYIITVGITYFLLRCIDDYKKRKEK